MTKCKWKTPHALKQTTSLPTRETDICLTQLASHVPVKLGVEIGRVDAICWGVNPWQLLLVESQELFGSVIDQRLGPGLTEWQNISRSTCAGRKRWTYQFVFVEASEPWPFFVLFFTFIQALLWGNRVGEDHKVWQISAQLHCLPLPPTPKTIAGRTGDETREERARDHIKINETGVASVWRPEHI